MFAHSQVRTVEWGDCDPAGIVFYPRYFAMFVAATAGLIEAARSMARAQIIDRFAVIGWPMLDTRAIYRAMTAYDDRVRINSRVVRLGRSSFDIELCLSREGTLCVEAFETRIRAMRGEAEVKSLPLPDDLRRALWEPVEAGVWE